jgi:hypothetical protein
MPYPFACSSRSSCYESIVEIRTLICCFASPATMSIPTLKEPVSTPEYRKRAVDRLSDTFTRFLPSNKDLQQVYGSYLKIYED